MSRELRGDEIPVWEYLKDHPHSGAITVANALGMKREHVQNIYQRLMLHGYAVRDKKGYETVDLEKKAWRRRMISEMKWVV